MFKVLIFISRVTDKDQVTSQSHVIEFPTKDLADDAHDQIVGFNREDPHHRAIAIRLYAPSEIW